MTAGRGMQRIGSRAAAQPCAVRPACADPARRAFGPLRRLGRGMGAVTLCLGLAACQPETGSVTLSPPQGASVERALEDFALALATAETVSEYCRPYGIRKTYSNADALSFDYARKLREQGYSQAEIARAADRLQLGNSAQMAIDRLQARGVREGDVGSLCRYGKEEVAKGSTVGKLLRVTQ